MNWRAAILTALAAAIVLQAGASTPALASKTQEASLQDDTRLLADAPGTLDELRRLGVQRVRVFVPWMAIAPGPRYPVRPPGFDATDPAQYPPANWSRWDSIVRDAAARGIGLDLTLTGGAPLWGLGPGAPGSTSQWDPSPSEFGAFVRAIATRYDGSYVPPGSADPLPRVDHWGIWNEPNYGPHLNPQAFPGARVEYSPRLYRNLLDHAWTALQGTGHGQDTILFGELAPRGNSFLGVFSGTKPLRFLRELYCVSASYRPLRGATAGALGCPTTAAGSRLFRTAHAALFQAAGFADHPYLQGSAPNAEPSGDPDYASLPRLPHLERVLDRLQRVYGSGTRFPIYLTEFGYITRPPRRSAAVSPALAAFYLNWAEYITWSDPRVRTLTQYLLTDPPPLGSSYGYGGFASGLTFHGGVHKAAYDAYRLPLYLPATTTGRGGSLEVWGCARPAIFGWLDDPNLPEQVQIQFGTGRRPRFATIRTVSITNPRGYFDQHVVFPSSGSVRLAWTYPGGSTVHSRVQQITLGR